MRRPALKTVLIGTVLFLALGLRIWGIGFGLLHADEPIIMNHAMGYGTGDLNPHFFKIPPLVSYLVFGLLVKCFFILKMAGVTATAEDFALFFLSNPVPFYTLARVVLGALLGTATVVWVYTEGKRFFSERAAMLGALFLAVNFLHVRESHFIYVDIPMVLACCLVVSAALRVWSSGSLQAYLIAGLFIGLAAALKYNAALSCVSVAAAHFLRDKREHRLLLISALFSLGAFFILNPFAFMNPEVFWDELRSQAGAEGWVGVGHVLGYSLWQGAGPGLLLFAAAGIYECFMIKPKAGVIYTAFPLLFLTTLVFFSQPHERYVLPLMPFLCLWAGFGAHKALSWGRPKIIRSLLFVGILLALLLPAYKSAQVSRLLAAPDTRQEAKSWIEAHVPAGQKIAFDHSSFRPALERVSAQWDSLLRREDVSPLVRKKLALEARTAREPGYVLYYLNESPMHSFSSVWPLLPYDVSELRQNEVRYVVVHTEHNDPHMPFKKSLADRATLVASFSPFRDAAQRVASDPFAVTCAPFTWEDILQRRSLGPLLEIYEIRG